MVAVAVAAAAVAVAVAAAAVAVAVMVVVMVVVAAAVSAEVVVAVLKAAASVAGVMVLATWQDSQTRPWNDCQLFSPCAKKHEFSNMDIWAQKSGKCLTFPTFCRPGHMIHFVRPVVVLARSGRLVAAQTGLQTKNASQFYGDFSFVACSIREMCALLYFLMHFDLLVFIPGPRPHMRTTLKKEGSDYVYF